MTSISTLPSNTTPVTTVNSAVPVAVPNNTDSLQPYTFVEGPPPDPSTLPYGTYTAGLPPPEVPPALLPVKTVSLSTNLVGLIAANPTSSTQAANVMAMVSSQLEEFMALMLSLRTSNLKNRDDEMVLKREQKELAISKGLDAAKLDLAAGIVAGAGLMVQSTMGVVAGFKGEGIQGATVGTGKFSSWGVGGNGIAGIVSSSLTYAGATVKAEQQRAELRAELASDRMAQASERGQNFKEAFLAALQGVNQLQQSQTDALKRTFV
jgi:hypothetical protein